MWCPSWLQLSKDFFILILFKCFKFLIFIFTFWFQKCKKFLIWFWFQFTNIPDKQVLLFYLISRNQFIFKIIAIYSTFRSKFSLPQHHSLKYSTWHSTSNGPTIIKLQCNLAIEYANSRIQTQLRIKLKRSI